jgi:hypothetical protein
LVISEGGSGRELQCTYTTWSTTLSPSSRWCYTDSIDYSSKFEKEKHSFSGSATEKYELKNFQISRSSQVDFIPLDILTEFPNLNGLSISSSKLPTVKSGLFKIELQKIEYLFLYSNQIVSIEANAFEYLSKLKWIRLESNKLESLSYKLFKNNPDLIYINLKQNKINSIHSNFFDGLQKLKLVQFDGNLCIQTDIGCETCSITPTDLNNKLENCFTNCAKDTTCHASILIPLIQENSRSSKDVLETTENLLNKTALEIITEIKNLRNLKKDFEVNVDRSIKEILKLNFNELSHNLTENYEYIIHETKGTVNLIVEKFEDQNVIFFNQTNDIKNECKSTIDQAMKSLTDEIKEASEANRKTNQETIEKLQKIVLEKTSNKLEKHLEKTDAKVDQTIEFLTAKLEVEKLKIELLTIENRGLKRKIEDLEEKQARELKSLEVKFSAIMQEKLVEFEKKLRLDSMA